jgi:hypothetical protein
MRTTLTLSDDVYEAAVTIARASGRRFGEVVSDLARAGLERSAPAHADGRFAQFVLPPGAPTLTAQRVQRALDEDGAL